jgi:hypothetical protein
MIYGSIHPVHFNLHNYGYPHLNNYIIVEMGNPENIETEDLKNIIFESLKKNEKNNDYIDFKYLYLKLVEKSSFFVNFLPDFYKKDLDYINKLIDVNPFVYIYLNILLENLNAYNIIDKTIEKEPSVLFAITSKYKLNRNIKIINNFKKSVIFIKDNILVSYMINKCKKNKKIEYSKNNLAYIIKPYKNLFLNIINHYNILIEIYEMLNYNKNFLTNDMLISQVFSNMLIKKDASIYDLLPHKYKEIYDIAMNCVRKDGSFFKKLPNKFKNIEYFIKAASKTDLSMFQYANPSLRNKKDIAMFAIKDPNNFNFLGNKLINDINFFIDVVKNYDNYFQYFPPLIQDEMTKIYEKI